MRLSRHFTSMRFPCMSIYALTLAWEQSRWLDRSITSVLSGKRRTKLPSNSFVSRSLNSIEVQNGTSIELDTKLVAEHNSKNSEYWIPNSTIQSQKDKFFMWNLPSIFQDPRSQIQSATSQINYGEPVYQRCILRSCWTFDKNFSDGPNIQLFRGIRNPKWRWALWWLFYSVASLKRLR